MTLTVTPDTSPGPGARIQRTAAQAGVSSIALGLVFAFGWFHSDKWSAQQVDAVSAAVFMVVSTLHNLWNMRAEKRRYPEAVTVKAEPASVPEKKAGK